jgi:hypothetical protein
MDNDSSGNTFSPPVQAPVVEPTMDFPTAIKKVIEGQKITRVSWNNTDYGFLGQDGFLSLYKNGETFTHWYVNDGDLKGQDWIVVT